MAFTPSLLSRVFYDPPTIEIEMTSRLQEAIRDKARTFTHVDLPTRICSSSIRGDYGRDGMYHVRMVLEFDLVDPNEGTTR